MSDAFCGSKVEWDVGYDMWSRATCVDFPGHDGNHTSYGQGLSGGQQVPVRIVWRQDAAEGCTNGPGCPVKGHEMTPVPGMGPEA